MPQITETNDKRKERFTPGPWVWHTSNSWRRLKHDDRGISENVLEPYVCRDGHPDCTVSEDDMALIAAAPALYEALENLVGEIEVGSIVTSAWPQMEKARAALAKALGEG